MADDRSAYLGRHYVPVRNVDTLSNVPNRKQSQEQYARPEEEEDKEENNQFRESEFMDRSAQLNASLKSLALINAPKVKKTTIKKSNKKEIEESKEPEQEISKEESSANIFKAE